MTDMVTPFSAELLLALSLGDPRLRGMAFGPWDICFEDDAISLDGVPVELFSWEHAEALAAGRREAQRGLEHLRAEFASRATVRRD